MKTKALENAVRKIIAKYPELKSTVTYSLASDSLYVQVLNAAETTSAKFRFADHGKQSAQHNPADHSYVVWPKVPGHTRAEVVEAFWSDLDNFYAANS